jgi:hypothetical protein
MPKKPDAPIQKVTLNLYKTDVVAMEKYYGYGWSEQVRQLVHQHIITTMAHYNTRKTIGDLT